MCDLMFQDQQKDCKKCVYFKNHDTFRYFGVCGNKTRLLITAPSMEVCDDYQETSLEDLKEVLLKKGWIRCLSCNKALYTVEDLVEHLEGELGFDLYSDIVASEESPVAG